MANQVIVTNTGNVQVALTPPPNVQVQISRAAIGTVSNVPTANFANYAGNVTASNQPNITNVGTLGNLNVSGTGTFGNVIVTGNLQVGNLVANNANYSNFAGIAFNVSGSNVTGAVANANYAANAGNATIANSANSVTLANVSGAGNIASINLDGNASNILFGNGTFSAIPVVSNVANANYANFSGTAFSVSGSNVSGEVANAAYANAANTANLATYATTANAVAGANVSGTVANANYSAYANIAATANSVAVANVSGIGNIAVINLDGNASNVLFGNGTFGPEAGNLNANYANFAGEAFNVNASNITGTVANANYSAYAGQANTANLATYATTANAVAGANVSGTVANATFALDAGNANLANLATYATTANSVAGANVSGTVANATFALDAGNSNLANTANSVALANVVGIGNIANINLDGNASNILFGNGTFSAIPVVSNVANANYANFAGTAFSVSGSNVSGEVANANFASYANIAASANSVALANVVGIGNIANINLDGSSSNVLFGNGVFAPESTSIANANYANFAGNLINGTSNISIPSANGTIAFSVNNVANLMLLENGGLVNAFPTSSAINMLRINTFNSAISDAHRIAWARARGSNTSPTSVQAFDRLGILSFFGHNGANYQTNSISLIRATVDGSYTANTANIPIGLQLIVNDTNGGVNNQAKTHQFYSNGTVSFANNISVSGNGNITGGNLITGNITANGGSFTFSNGTGGATALTLTGDKTTNSTFNLSDAQFSVTMSNVDTSGGYSPFRFNQYTSLSNTVGGMFMYRSRGTGFANSLPVTANDQIMSLNFLVNSNNTTTSVGQFVSTVTSNDNAGNVGIKLDFNALGTGTTGYLNGAINLNANTTTANNIIANTFTGSGANLSNITGANVTGQVANALVASTVYTNAQPNITSTGNLISLNVVNSANVTGTIQQLAPNTITITTNATSNTAYDLTTIYGETSNIVEPGQRAIIRSRGNVSTPATVAVSDVGSRDRVYFYNGTTNAIGFTSTVALSNLNSNSNAFTTGTNYNVSTGNPNGDQGNANAISGFNTLSLRDTGQLLLIPGANSTAGSMLNMINYGLSTSLSTAQGLTMSRARGNRDANLSVEANDQIGRIVFQPHNGTSFVTNRLPIIRSTVDSSYVANSANIPAGLQFVVNDNTSSYTHNFYANGNVQFSNGATFGSLTQDTIVDIKGNNGNGYVRLNGVAFSVIQTDANAAAGYSPFFFYTYQSNNDPIPSSKFFRAGGNIGSPTAVSNGSNIALNQYAAYADSGNTYKPVFEQQVTVTSNDGVGNLTGNMNFYAYNTGSNINLQANTYANNVSISSGGFMKLASYTAAGLTAVTGQIGWMAAVSNSGGGGNPNGMIAFWDTTNSRWSYIHDNSAV